MPTPAFKLEIRPSRILRWGWILVHLLALVAPWFSAMPLAVAALLSSAIAVHGWWQWRRLAESEWEQLLYVDGVWRLVKAQREVVVRPKGEVYISAVLLTMRFVTEESKSTTLVLLPDSCDRDQLRRLRVWLRMGIGVDHAA